ncbi:hypothetical protein [Gilvibacter sp.]|uniref:hypothetical protein n=1 Tax=Gilvibacter sp. TaxID=2729997 RepID=UPI003B51C1B3
MKKKVIYSIIMDRSSSMWEIRDEILESVNQQIATIKEMETLEEEVLLTDLTLFNERVSRVLSLITQSQLRILSNNDYNVNGTTALYDAIGSTLERLFANYNEEVLEKKCKVVVVIYTDGYENASRMYSASEIRRMLDRANEMEGVEINIVGCEDETLTMAENMHFRSSNIVRVNKEDLASSLKELDSYLYNFRNDKMFNFKQSLKKFDQDTSQDEDTDS